MTQHHTSPQSVTIEHARTVMAGVLTGHLPLEDRLTVGEALSVLSDVHPPYPPLPDPERPEPDVLAAIEDVLAMLDLAILQSRGVEEVIRCGSTARILRERFAREPQ